MVLEWIIGVDMKVMILDIVFLDSERRAMISVDESTVLLYHGATATSTYRVYMFFVMMDYVVLCVIL